MGKGGKLGHVADALGKGQDGGPPPKQVRKPLRGLKARRVVVEGEEDPGAAPQGGGDPLHALGAQGGAGGQAPPGKDKPVEDALGKHRPGRRGAEPAKPKHRLGAGQGLETGLHLGVQGPAHKPADKAAGCLPRTRYGVGNDHHAGEPLRTALQEQAGVPEPVGGEASRLKGLSQPAPRREAETQAGCGVKPDAPRGKVLPRLRVTAELPGVEPRRRRQQGRVPRRNRGGRATGWGGTPDRPGSQPWAAVKPLDRLRQAQVVDAPHEVKHVAAKPAAEAVPPLRVCVHRE